MKKIPNKLENLVPRKKEDTTIRLIVQQDVAENVRQLFQALAKLKEKDINDAISIGERFFKLIVRSLEINEVLYEKQFDKKFVSSLEKDQASRK